jgi:hypothetical protein
MPERRAPSARPEWQRFSVALKALVEAAGYNKTKFATFLGLDRRVIGPILEAREACPEDVLIRLYKRRRNDGNSRLGDAGDLRLLVELWADASGDEPGDLLRQQMASVGTPWETKTGGDPTSASGDRFPSREPALATSRTIRRVVPALIGVLALIGVGAVASLAWPRDPHMPESGRHVTASHRFAADYSGDVQVHIRPSARNVSRDHSILLEWGAVRAEVQLADLPAEGETLVTWKHEEDESVPLSVTVEPSAAVTFRTGSAPDGVDINPSWRDR